MAQAARTIQLSRPYLDEQEAEGADVCVPGATVAGPMTRASRECSR